MREQVIYRISHIYRDDFRVRAFLFGQGEKALCIVGNTRGNEYQQIFICSQVVQRLKKLEEEGRFAEGYQVMVIPSVNPSSMNIGKRFWSVDNTDINRMFPGYNEGETTQRIADGIFQQIKGYRYGVQMTSFYMSGNFVPQIRMMKTGRENVELAKSFGMPYVVLHNPRPFDTATLNYNWQIWETDAFSLYTTSTSSIDKASASQACAAILNFMSKQDVINYRGYEGYISRVVETSDFLSLRAEHSGFFESRVRAGSHVAAGEELAVITDPYTAEVRQQITSPIDGIIAFLHDETLAFQNTAMIKLIADED